MLNAETNRPVVKARVTLSSDTGADPVSMFTDANGHFQFTPLAAGRYTLVTEKTGFARLRYGAATSLDPPLEITVSAASPAEDVVVRLTRGAAISGRITDDLGDPVIGGDVTASAVQMIGETPRLVPLARPASDTNDLGDYRIGDLPPGRYFVSIAGATLGSLPGGEPREWERLVPWGRTLYPGATSLSEAAPVTVGPGEERSGVDFSVSAYDRMHLGLTVSGILPGGPGGVSTAFAGGRGVGAAQPIWITFVPSDPSIPITQQNTITLYSNSTSFGIGNAPIQEPGDWIVFARQAGNGGAIVHVRLASGDDQMLSLDLAPGAKVSGRVILDAARALPSFDGVRIKAAGAGSEKGLTAELLHPTPEKVKADGTFQVPDLFGTVTLDADTPPGWTLKSVMLGNRDLLDDPLVLKSGENVSGVRVTLSDRVSTLSGTAALADATPAAGCGVVVFPADPSLRFSQRRTRFVRADRRGTFMMRDVPAGSYRIAASPDIDAASWLTEESLDRLNARSVPIAVAGSGQQSVSLSCAVTP